VQLVSFLHFIFFLDTTILIVGYLTLYCMLSFVKGYLCSYHQLASGYLTD
jgi:hypothetical protein